MKIKSVLIALLALALLPPIRFSIHAAEPPREPVRVIFDTDMGNDVDDAMALALLHALEARGECRVLAVTLTKNHPQAGPFVDALNTFYGRGGIPVGVRRAGGSNDTVNFLPLAAARDGGQLRYPSKLDNATAPDAVDLLRQTLAAQPDQSVVVAQVGFSYNLARLLETPADRELVAKKVRKLVVMGGAFQPIGEDKHYLEFNVQSEIPPAQKLARDWPTPIVWSGFEIGWALRYPAASIGRDFNYRPHHIIPEAYAMYAPMPHERPLWDLTAALYAVRPERDYFDLSPPGKVIVEADGFTRFEPQANGRDRYLILKPEQISRTREALVELVTQPPAAKPEGADAAIPRSGNPVFPGWYADPEAAVFGTNFWIYPTYSARYEEQTFMDAFSSPDLIHWTKHPRVLSTNAVTWARRALWAPALVEKDGRYFLFFGANDIQNDNEVGGIGVAVADQPEGPFTDYLGQPLVDKFHHGAQPIDQFVFRDHDGQYYLIYGGWRHCNIGRLAPDFKSIQPFADGTLFKEITPERYVEGPCMIERQGKYYLMWSEGGWTGPDYSVAYAIADAPVGPFQRIGKILQQDPAVGTGAGHHSVIKLPGQDVYYIVYHRHPLGDTNGNHRVTCIDKMEFDAQGHIQPVKITFEGVEAAEIKSASLK